MNTPDWPSLIDEALTRARGTSLLPVKGAKLRRALEDVLIERDLNLTSFLRSEHLSFSQFLAIYSPNLKVIKQQGSDMLVAKSQEELSSTVLNQSPQSRLSVRSDLYSALMDFSEDVTWYYDINKDRVERVQEGLTPSTRPELIPFPKTSRDEQIKLRQSFLDTYKIPPLQTFIGDKGNFLRTFMNYIYGAGLAEKWHEFKFGFLKAKLLQWAAEHKLEVKQDWFINFERKKDRTPDIAYLLRQLAIHLSDEELRRLPIPLGAVYDFWLSQIRRQN